MVTWKKSHSYWQRWVLHPTRTSSWVQGLTSLCTAWNAGPSQVTTTFSKELVAGLVPLRFSGRNTGSEVRRREFQETWTLLTCGVTLRKVPSLPQTKEIKLADSGGLLLACDLNLPTFPECTKLFHIAGPLSSQSHFLEVPSTFPCLTNNYSSFETWLEYCFFCSLAPQPQWRSVSLLPVP